MDETKLLNILLPIFTAALGVWVGQFIKWNFEKRKLRYEERKLFIAKVREYLHNSSTWSRKDFKQTALYTQLRPHLSKKLLEKIDAPLNTIHMNSVGSAVDINIEWVELFHEVSALEKKWGLL
jgi:hypothetical protein